MRAWVPALLVISLGHHTARAIPPSAVLSELVTTTTTTGEKPQSKVWTHAGAWWCVLAKSSGTWLMKLQGTQWVEVIKLSTFTNIHADAKPIGDVVHILLYRGTASQLVSVEYVNASQTYRLWTLRPAPSAVSLDTGVETATIDIDSRGRMWLTSDASTTINARYSDSPYSIWSSPITVATGVSTDDICVVTAIPSNKIGVMWSNQATRRFGCRIHVDGADPNTWSADEVPASQSANDAVGTGMADDHLNVAVASDGTLYVAIKTGFDTPGYPLMALLVRRPGGTWDNLYDVSQSLSASRPIVLLNETTDQLTIVFKNGNYATNDQHIAYSQSSTSPIVFGVSDTLTNVGLNNATSTKENINDEVVILASTNTTAYGIRWSFLNNPPTVASAPPDTAVAEDSGPVDNYRDLNAVFSDVEDGGALAFAVQSNSNPTLINAMIDVDSTLDMGFTPNVTGSATLIIRATDSGNLFVEDTLVVTVTGLVTAIGEPAIPSRFALYQNVPNPFNPTTVIRYDVPVGGGKVTLQLFDVSGKLIRTLADGFQMPGEKTLTWDGRDERGNPVASGAYFCRLQAPGFERNRKMVLVH